MEDIRGSLSRLKKGIKNRLTGSKRKADKPGVGGSEPNTDNESAEPSAPTDGNESDWKSIVSSTAKSLLRGVRDSADVFPPLKSVAGGLCFALENCEVRSPSPLAAHGAYRCPSERRQTNRR
jgi:hypothetical protein